MEPLTVIYLWNMSLLIDRNGDLHPVPNICCGEESFCFYKSFCYSEKSNTPFILLTCDQKPLPLPSKPAALEMSNESRLSSSSSYIGNEARMKKRTNRISKDNSPHRVSTIFSNVSKTGNISQFICKMAQTGTAVKGVSCYRPNIDMFRRRALWSMQRRRARDAQKWFAASQLPRHLWLWLQRALSGRLGALCKSKPGECVHVQYLHKDAILCIAKYILAVWCIDDALTSSC